MAEYTAFYWRVGRKVGRTIYACLGDKPSNDDPLIGVMDTEALAKDAVVSHNLALARDRGLIAEQEGEARDG